MNKFESGFFCITPYFLFTIFKGALLGGSRGACAPLLFCSPRGIHTYKKMYMLFIFPEIPRFVHPCYLGQMGAPDHFLGKDVCILKYQRNKIYFPTLAFSFDYVLKSPQAKMV